MSSSLGITFLAPLQLIICTYKQPALRGHKTVELTAQMAIDSIIQSLYIRGVLLLLHFQSCATFDSLSQYCFCIFRDLCSLVSTLLPFQESTKEHPPVKCFIPTMHLTDHPSLAASLLNSFAVDDLIEEAVCFEKDSVPIMSLKPSIIQVFYLLDCCQLFNPFSSSANSDLGCFGPSLFKQVSTNTGPRSAAIYKNFPPSNATRFLWLSWQST